MMFRPVVPAVLLVSLLLAGAASAQPPASAGDDLDRILAQAADMHQAGDLLGAVDAYKVVLQSAPQRADVRSNLGAALVKLGRLEEGMEQYREAIRIEPDNAAYHFNLGLALYKGVRPAEAIPEFRRVLALDPAHRAAVLLLADCLSQAGEDADVVATLQPRAAEFTADLAYAYLLGISLIRTGDRESGQILVDRIFRAGESAEGRLLMGLAHLTAYDFKAAITELARAVELNPELPRVYTIYGRALLSSGDSDGANRQFLKALEQNPNDFDANLQLGGIRQRAQRFDEALVYLGRAAALRPKDVAVRHATASVYLAQGQAEKALPLLEGVVKDAPEYVDARVLLATTYYRLKRREDGDRERAVAAKLTAERQAKQPGARQDTAPEAPVPQGPTDRR
jgi:tetratricopeptide (TPR) repeat protein